MLEFWWILFHSKDFLWIVKSKFLFYHNFVQRIDLAIRKKTSLLPFQSTILRMFNTMAKIWHHEFLRFYFDFCRCFLVSHINLCMIRTKAAINLENHLLNIHCNFMPSNHLSSLFNILWIVQNKIEPSSKSYQLLHTITV